ncbi:hypothetical protein LguiA_030742 [Lonicera macranthoides]
MAFLNSLTNCSQLELLEASNNQLGGVFPNSLGNLSTRMRHFRVGINQISGVIPSGVGSLFSLEILYMTQNQFKGEIPDVIDNKLEGTIPSSLGNCKNLISLDLSQNNLSGRIPKELFSASAIFELNVSWNHLVGPILSQVGNMKNLVELDASENKLSGKILIELGKCSDLVNLYLGGNFFEGSIPPSFESLWGVQNLDISSNNLSVSYGDLHKATNGFTSTNLIGVGSFGFVYKGILDREEKMVVVKVLNLQRQGVSRSFMAECEALRNIRHRNLVKIITSCSSIDF